MEDEAEEETKSNSWASNIIKLVISNMYAATKQDNKKLNQLHGQMDEMDTDFEEMMRMRNEAKKRLEEKFKDVY